jgi:hypothetical protein
LKSTIGVLMTCGIGELARRILRPVALNPGRRDGKSTTLQQAASNRQGSKNDDHALQKPPPHTLSDRTARWS